MVTLVTGATGLVGNNVTRLLLDRGQAVRVLVRRQSDPRSLEGLDVERVYGDVRDAAAVGEACRGAAAVVHSAALIHIGWKGLDEQRAINVTGAAHVAAAARAAGIRMVHVSTVDTLAAGRPAQPADEESVGEKPPCTYVVTKREAERGVFRAIDEGLDAVIVNPGFMLGPWDWKPSSGRMLLEVARRFTPLAPRGGCSVCDVRDVAAGILAALDRGQSARRYILAGHNTSYLDLWRLFARISGSSAPWARMWRITQLAGGLGGDLWARVSGREGDVNSAAIRMSALFNYYTSARAQSELGYQVRPLDESVRDAWQWFRQHGYA